MAAAHDADICDLCGDTVQVGELANVLSCTFRECGELTYHQACLESFLKGKKLERNRKTGFPCPRGSGKGSQYATPCSGRIDKSHPILPKNERKRGQVVPEQQQQQQPKTTPTKQDKQEKARAKAEASKLKPADVGKAREEPARARVVGPAVAIATAAPSGLRPAPLPPTPTKQAAGTVPIDRKHHQDKQTLAALKAQALREIKREAGLPLHATGNAASSSLAPGKPTTLPGITGATTGAWGGKAADLEVAAPPPHTLGQVPVLQQLLNQAVRRAGLGSGSRTPAAAAPGADKGSSSPPSPAEPQLASLQDFPPVAAAGLTTAASGGLLAALAQASKWPPLPAAATPATPTAAPSQAPHAASKQPGLSHATSMHLLQQPAVTKGPPPGYGLLPGAGLDTAGSAKLAAVTVAEQHSQQQQQQAPLDLTQDSPPPATTVAPAPPAPPAAAAPTKAQRKALRKAAVAAAKQELQAECTPAAQPSTAHAGSSQTPADTAPPPPAAYQQGVLLAVAATANGRMTPGPQQHVLLPPPAAAAAAAPRNPQMQQHDMGAPHHASPLNTPSQQGGALQGAHSMHATLGAAAVDLGRTGSMHSMPELPQQSQGTPHQPQQGHLALEPDLMEQLCVQALVSFKCKRLFNTLLQLGFTGWQAACGVRVAGCHPEPAVTWLLQQFAASAVPGAGVSTRKGAQAAQQEQHGMQAAAAEQVLPMVDISEELACLADVQIMLQVPAEAIYQAVNHAGGDVHMAVLLLSCSQGSLWPVMCQWAQLSYEPGWGPGTPHLSPATSFGHPVQHGSVEAWAERGSIQSEVGSAALARTGSGMHATQANGPVNGQHLLWDSQDGGH